MYKLSGSNMIIRGDGEGLLQHVRVQSLCLNGLYLGSRSWTGHAILSVQVHNGILFTTTKMVSGFDSLLQTTFSLVLDRMVTRVNIQCCKQQLSTRIGR